jgi:ketosteroid isomerase-like protein
VKAEHLETIHNLYDAMNRRDLDALRALGREHPDFYWDSAADQFDYPGRLSAKALFSYTKELFEIFEDLHTEILEEIDLDSDHVVFVVRHRVRGAGSGAEAARSEVHLWTVRDGRLESLREFLTVDEAREAAARS